MILAPPPKRCPPLIAEPRLPLDHGLPPQGLLLPAVGRHSLPRQLGRRRERPGAAGVDRFAVGLDGVARAGGLAGAVPPVPTGGVTAGAGRPARRSERRAAFRLRVRGSEQVGLGIRLEELLDDL